MTSTLILASARRAVRSRPLLILSATSVASATSYAYYVEHQTTSNASKYINDNTENAVRNKHIDSINHRTSVLPENYDRSALSMYWSHRPISVVSR